MLFIVRLVAEVKTITPAVVKEECHQKVKCIFVNLKKYIVLLKQSFIGMVTDHRISSTDSKVRTTN